jgi:hypothetical protein
MNDDKKRWDANEKWHAMKREVGEEAYAKSRNYNTTAHYAHDILVACTSTSTIRVSSFQTTSIKLD